MRLIMALFWFCLLTIQATIAATYVFTSQDSNIHINGRITGPTDDWNLWITPGVSFTGPDVGPSNRRPPAEADMQEYFRVRPPSVHQMVLTLERAGFIRRQPRVARSIELLVDPQQLPELL